MKIYYVRRVFGATTRVTIISRQPDYRIVWRIGFHFAQDKSSFTVLKMTSSEKEKALQSVSILELLSFLRVILFSQKYRKKSCVLVVVFLTGVVSVWIARRLRARGMCILCFEYKQYGCARHFHYFIPYLTQLWFLMKCGLTSY